MRHLIYSAQHRDMPISSSEGTCCTVLLNVTDMLAPTSYQCHANDGSNVSSQDQHHFESSATCVFEKVNPSAHSGRYTHTRDLHNGNFNSSSLCGMKFHHLFYPCSYQQTSKQTDNKQNYILNFSQIFSSSIGTIARCGLWPVEQHPSTFFYPSPTFSIFSLPSLEDLFLLPLIWISI